MEEISKEVQITEHFQKRITEHFRSKLEEDGLDKFFYIEDVSSWKIKEASDIQQVYVSPSEFGVFRGMIDNLRITISPYHSIDYKRDVIVYRLEIAFKYEHRSSLNGYSYEYVAIYKDKPCSLIFERYN